MDYRAEPAVGDLMSPPYFSGVYADEPCAGPDPFNTPGWLSHCQHAAEGIPRCAFLGTASRSAWRTALGKGYAYLRSPRWAARHFLTGTACARHLWPVAAMIRDLYLQQGKVSVLDIGGGFGDNFFELLNVLDPKILEGLRYDIVDNEGSRELGQHVFRDYRARPAFLPNATERYDIVMLIGTLQYVQTWRDLLRSIRSRYLYIARSPIATEVASYATTQWVCPTLGSHAGRLIGTTRVHVIGLEDLRAPLSQWRPCFEWADTDYSAQFSRLPSPWRQVRYYCMGWAAQ